MDINDVLQMHTEGEGEADDLKMWDRVMKPKASYLLTGDVGSGKSALAYFLLERYAEKYSLTPTVVGLPENKKTLVPEGFAFVDTMDELPSREDSIVFIDEADIQLPLDNNKSKEMVINFLSLPRQRRQIFILAYHFPRLVKGTYLPFFSAFLFKMPPYLHEFASKKGSDELKDMMKKAMERFNELPVAVEEYDELPPIVRSHSYIVAPRIRWQGMIENPLPSFWSQELSEVWSGVGITERQGDRLVVSDQLKIKGLFKRQDDDVQSNTTARLTKVRDLFPSGNIPYERIIEYDQHFSLLELKQQAMDLGLSLSGDKKELAAKIIAYDSQQEEP